MQYGLFWFLSGLLIQPHFHVLLKASVFHMGPLFSSSFCANHCVCCFLHLLPPQHLRESFCYVLFILLYSLYTLLFVFLLRHLLCPITVLSFHFAYTVYSCVCLCFVPFYAYHQCISFLFYSSSCTYFVCAFITVLFQELKIPCRNSVCLTAYSA